MWNKSIRAKLVAVVIAPILLVLLVVGSVSYLSAHEEVGEVYDADLSNVAKLIYSLVYADEANETPHYNSDRLDDAFQKQGHAYEKYIVFKVWRQNKLLFASKGDLDFGDNLPEGFLDKDIKGGTWRQFVLDDAQHGYRVAVAEKLSARMDIIEKFLASIFLPLALSVPFIIFIAWVGLRTSLGSLVSISSAVQKRTSSDLSPITFSPVPEEVSPLVSSINELLVRLSMALQKERRFTDFAAHELRTPIAVLKLQAQTALKSTDENERRTILESHVRAADRATHMVSQLLTLARLDHADIPKQDVHLQNLAQQIAQDLEPLAEKKGINLQLAVKNITVARTNPDVLAVVLRNIIDNAIKYTPEHGAISVTTDQQDRKVLISVSDTGSGVPHDQLSKITERFFRIAGNSEQGAGLGLSIVQRGVEIMGGILRITNNKGQSGLTVTIEFSTMSQPEKPILGQP